jgi:hypothetical protein
MHLTLRRLAVFACAALVLSGCAQQMRTAEISHADVSENGLTIELVIDACVREREKSVEESAESVVVEYRITTKTGDCGFSGIITLATPLGDRVLIDAYDNEPISLTPWQPGADDS